MKPHRPPLLLCAASFVLFLALGCNKSNQKETKQHFGVEIDKAAPHVTLAELVAHPGTYEGKTIVVDGQFNGACADGADFYFKDKFDMIEADPPQPEVMSLSKGTPIRLYGIVKVHHSRAEESEKRDASEKRTEKSEKETNSEAAEVKIAAKGLEVLK